MFVFRRLASPLHATRASVGALWAMALVFAALAIDHPLILCVLVVTIVLAGTFAGVGGEVVRSLRTATIVAVPIVTVNVLVSREGLTVFARLGDLGPFGQGNLTVEALVYGTIVALKVTILMLATTLASLAVDPDELLRVVRRLSFRSALTASLATRMIPVLANDARRLAEAQRTRVLAPTGARARIRLLSAMIGNSLDRAMDVAATLELRGFAEARRAPRLRRPWSRHDVAFAASASAAAMVALAFVARLDGVGRFDAYPQLNSGDPLATAALTVAFAIVLLLPFADRRGIER
ncbi:MAG TPA: energy-coupling factor transporter transmembrane component T [Solirubrobacteraceae bacterium]